jgi:hypothetical protein
MILDMCPDCQLCGRDLPPDSPDARICSFECTYCADCAEKRLGGICPNCGGDLERRPTRAEQWLEKYPPSQVRKGPS